MNTFTTTYTQPTANPVIVAQLLAFFRAEIDHHILTTEPRRPRTVGEIVATVKANVANGTAVYGPTHYDKLGNAIDLRRQLLPQSTAEFHRQFPCRQDCRHGCPACEDAPEPTDTEYVE